MARKRNDRRAILFIAYHYPPMQGIGVERSTKFVRYLPEFGYEPTVLTTSAFGREGGDVRTLRAWEPLSWYRRALGSSGDPAERTERGWLSQSIRWVSRRVLVPDVQATWAPAAKRIGLRSLATGQARLIYSTSPPASAHRVALNLKKKTGLPWVADFRDAWTADPLDPVLLEVPLRHRLERRMEREVITTADITVAASEMTAEYLRESCPSAAARIAVITNGFDPADLPDTPAAPPPNDGPLCIIHTGSFGYSHPERTPKPLFGALEQLLSSDPSWVERIRVVLVGRLTASERLAALRLQESGVVELDGPVDRKVAIAHQHRAHLLLLVDHARPWPSPMIPAKFYEYLAAGRPILALCGEGMVRRMMAELDAGVCATPDDAHVIAGAIEDLYVRYRRGDLPSGVARDRLRPFERRELTRRLAGCFDALLGDADGGEVGQ